MDRIVSFWGDGPLPRLHLECVKSWVRLGYHVRMCTYGSVPNAPEGVIIEDANAFLSKADADRLPNWVAISDIIRLSMLAKNEGIWVDTDLFLKQRIPDRGGLVLGEQWKGKPCNALLCFPEGAGVAEDILSHFQKGSIGPWAYAKPRFRKLKAQLLGKPFSFAQLPNSHWGSHALEYYIRKNNWKPQMLPQRAFYADETYDGSLFKAGSATTLIEDSEVYGFHFFFKKADYNSPEPGSVYAWMCEQGQ